MRSFFRIMTLTALLFVAISAIPGCSSDEGAGGMSGKMGGAMDKGKMEGGAMDKGKMSGGMSGKMDGGAMDKGKMDAPAK